MRTVNRCLVVAAFAFLVHGRPASANGATWSLGVGNLNCDVWTGRRAEKPDHIQVLLIVSWVQGWLTADSEDLYTVSNGKERLKHIDDKAIADWLDDYCAANPFMTIDDVVKRLQFQLRTSD